MGNGILGIGIDEKVAEIPFKALPAIINGNETIRKLKLKIKPPRRIGYYLLRAILDSGIEGYWPNNQVRIPVMFMHPNEF